MPFPTPSRSMAAARWCRRMTGELMAMRRRIMDTQELLTKWKVAADRIKPPRRQQRQLRSMEFQF